jgi:hypothetical protein
MASVFCEECIYDMDFSDKGSVLSCLATIAIGVIVRAIEKKRIKKSLKQSDNKENSNS